MDDTLLQLLKACCEGKVESDFVLTRERGKKLKKVTKVKTFYKLWDQVCERAKVFALDKNGNTRKLLFHDLRRTAVSGMRRLEIPESVAMKITGHKTREVFARYDIVSPTDIRAAQQRVSRHRQQIAKAAKEKEVSSVSDKVGIKSGETQDDAAQAHPVQ